VETENRNAVTRRVFDFALEHEFQVPVCLITGHDQSPGRPVAERPVGLQPVDRQFGNPTVEDRVECCTAKMAVVPQ
jgi:hypothetical protein